MTATGVLLAALLVLVVVTAGITAVARTLPTTLVAFAAYSLGLAMVWVVFRAPDVALTEAAVGAGVTTALFLVLLRRTSGSETTQPTTPTQVATPMIAPLALVFSSRCWRWCSQQVSYPVASNCPPSAVYSSCEPVLTLIRNYTRPQTHTTHQHTIDGSSQ